MDSRIFRITTAFGKPHLILLDFSKSGLYLINLSSDTYLGFSKDVNIERDGLIIRYCIYSRFVKHYKGY